MKKFTVSALGTEALQTIEIEAKNAEEVKEKYRAMWENGEVQALDYAFDHFTVTDHETGKDITLKD
jgi:hypothetical protein